MKVMEIRDKFAVDCLQLVERPDRGPGPGQVVRKMKAFSVNYRDLFVVNGVGDGSHLSGGFPCLTALVSLSLRETAYPE